MKDQFGYEYLGYLSATDPAYARGMDCHDCMVSWTGCWDNFMCPKCGKGELPKANLMDIIDIGKEK